MTVTVGDDTSQTTGTSVGRFQSSDMVVTFLSLHNRASADGTLKSFSCKLENNNTNDYTLTGQFVIYSCVSLGGTSYRLSQRSASDTFNIADTGGAYGIYSISSQSVTVREGDVIGLKVTCPTGTYGVGDAIVVAQVDDGQTDCGKLYTGSFSGGTVDFESDYTQYQIYGTGDDWPIGGGVGGDPKQACHTVDETVGIGEQTSGTWGTIVPRDFDVIGTKKMYADVTFPWDTTGIFTEDEIFQDGITKYFDNPDNSTEHYSLKCSIIGTTLPAINLENGDFEYDNDVWGIRKSDGFIGWGETYYNVYVSHGSHSAVMYPFTMRFLDAGTYIEIYQSTVFFSSTSIITFDFYIVRPNTKTVVKVMLDSNPIDTFACTSKGWNLNNEVIVNTSTGTHELSFRLEVVDDILETDPQYSVNIDYIRVNTIETGVAYNFYECWWTDSPTGDVYVKTDGNDSDLGISWETAWKTYDKAYSNVPDGGTINIEAGSYTTSHSSVFPVKDCQVKPYKQLATNGDKVIITKT